MPTATRTLRPLLTALLAGAALVAVPAGAASPPKAPATVPAAERQAEQGRAVAVVLPQKTIAVSSDAGRVALSPGGSLLGALLIADMEKDKANQLRRGAQDRAEAAARPIREALDGLDVAALARKATDQALAATPWLKAGDAHAIASSDEAEIAAFAAASSGDALVLVRYLYEISPDCTQIRVGAQVELARRGKAASSPPTVLYRGMALAVSELRLRSFEPSDNGREWVSVGDARVRAALEDSFTQAARLLPRLLDLPPETLARYRDRKQPQAFGAGFNGTLVEREGEALLIWSNDRFVRIAPAPDAMPDAAPDAAADAPEPGLPD